MAILTKFLQLLKPEKNDYVDVEKHLSENYDKIDTKLEELSNSNDEKLDKGNVPNVLNSAETIFKALQANTGIKFDESLLYLNDSGTKKKGYCYIDKLTDGIFECIQETTTTVNNATYFKNFSNKENSDRLSNLSESYYSDIDFDIGKIFFHKIGNLVMCTSLIKLSTNIKSGTTIIGTVPLNFRPYKTIEIPVTGASAEVAHTVLCNIDINSDGIIKLYSSVQLTNVDFRINSCWFNK